MGNFLDNVIKSREEWLKKPNPVPTRARYLNANLNTSLVEEVVVIDAQLDPTPESVLEPNSETVSITK
jgi:hypothetical protein